MRKIKLKELASYNKGQQINGNMLLNEGKYEYLNGGINPSGKWNEYNVEGNTIAISEGGNSCGYVNYMNRNFWCGAHCYYLFNIKCNVKYLFYNLKYNERRLQNIRSGACMPNIKKKELGEFEIFIDEDIKIQNKIASYLDRISYIMQNRKKQIEELDELIKSQFVEMFGDINTNTKNFNSMLLKECCTKITDGTHDTPKRYNSGVLLITGKNIRENGFDLSNIEYVSEEDHKKIYSRCNPEKGDILYTNIGVNYCTAMINSLDIEFSMKNVALLKPDYNKINSFYFSYALNYMKNKIVELNKGAGAQTFIGLSAISEIIIPIPSITLQNKFAEFVKQIDKQKFEIQKSLEEMQLLQESLMNKYFGEM